MKWNLVNTDPQICHFLSVVNRGMVRFVLFCTIISDAIPPLIITESL